METNIEGQYEEPKPIIGPNDVQVKDKVETQIGQYVDFILQSRL